MVSHLENTEPLPFFLSIYFIWDSACHDNAYLGNRYQGFKDPVTRNEIRFLVNDLLARPVDSYLVNEWQRAYSAVL